MMISDAVPKEAVASRHGIGARRRMVYCQM